ncbi:hypothetical protein FRC11_011114, partial [Ceratobasidium sp. 423]
TLTGILDDDPRLQDLDPLFWTPLDSTLWCWFSGSPVLGSGSGSGSGSRHLKILGSMMEG